MVIEIIIALGVGILFGIITGLTPGIHVNLISLLLISASSFLLDYFSLLSLSVFIIAMSITHSFIDSIPSVFLGAPDSDTALGVLPGHRYLLNGQGYLAVKLTLIGSFGAIILSLILFPFLIPVVKYGYPLIKNYIGWFLLGVVIFMILKDSNKIWALILFLLSGTLGVIVLNLPYLKNPLFPMLSGLFGTSTLIISLMGKENIVKQRIDSELNLNKKKTFKALISGQASGFLTAVFPGLGSATAAVLSMQFTKDLDEEAFLILIGSINTVNFTLSLLTLLVLNKARNGAVITIQKLIEVVSLNHVLIFLAIALISGSIALILGLKIARGFSNLITKINYKGLVIGIILFIVLLTFILTSALGFLVLVVSTFLGMIAPEKGIPRIHSMGCLLLPVMVYFLI